MSGILFIGDPHGLIAETKSLIAATGPSAVVLMGDMELPSPLAEIFAGEIASGIAIHFIPGNHEGDHEAWFANAFDPRTPEASLHGEVRDIDGRKVAGLGGVFRKKIWDPRTGRVVHGTREAFLRVVLPKDRFLPGFGPEEEPGLPLRHRVTIFPDDVHRLADRNCDILVTHEAPTAHPLGYEVIDNLARSMGADIIVHGHHHQTYEAWLGRIRVIGVGEAEGWGLGGQFGDGAFVGRGSR